MSDMTLDYVARPAAMRNEVPNFGIVVMMALALASATIGFSHPEAINAEFQTAAVVLAGL
jgi:hypothetical protein